MCRFEIRRFELEKKSTYIKHQLRLRLSAYLGVGTYQQPPLTDLIYCVPTEYSAIYFQ